MAAALFLVSLTGWLHVTFGKVGFDQFRFHVQEGWSGLGDADPDLIVSFGLACVAAPLAALALIEWGMARLRRRVTEGRCAAPGLAAACLKAERVGLAGLLALSGAAQGLAGSLSMWEHLHLEQYSGFIDAHYVAPDRADLVVPETRRNLVVIYVESLETSYRDRHRFGRNLLDALDLATHDWLEFDYRAAGGAGWTMGAIVASQCGVPLRPLDWTDALEFSRPVDGNSLGEVAPAFLPRLECLGDVLASAGYRNVFMGGASLAFAGKGKFLQGHGYQEVWGKEQWEQTGHHASGAWGLYDDELLRQVRTRLEQLQAEGQPFHLTVLTLDTHHPAGFISPTCQRRGVRDFEGIVECTSGLLAEFVNDFKRRGWQHNTDLLIVGDHLAMRNPVHRQLSTIRERALFFRLLTSTPLAPNRPVLNPYSVFPTVLVALGFEIPRGQLAMGVSALGDLPQTTRHIVDEPDLDLKLAAPAPIYSHFWGR